MPPKKEVNLHFEPLLFSPVLNYSKCLGYYPDMNKSKEHELILVLGGARSGKSSWALRYAEEQYRPCIFIATAEVMDEEMAERVRLHKESRGPSWKLIEEPLNIDNALKTECAHAEAVLIDCMTVWLSNVLLKMGKKEVSSYQKRLLEMLSQRRQAVIIVSNEVGSGIVPEHPLGREFRDLAGILNQKLAAIADRVVLTVAGIPVNIK
jgi:adenosylcobinamide kinase / adenosylcobinamide-phosphate guanylyltransferase